MINRPLELLSFTDVEDLVGRAEDRRMEFKLEVPGGSDAARKEFLADISSLANAQGGDIVYGVKEEAGLATEVPGLALEDPDSAILRLESIVRDGLQPRLIGMRSTYVKDFGSSRGALIVRVPASLQSPHRVVFQNWGRFFTRHSRGKAEMDVVELREAFNGSAATLPSLRALHGSLPNTSHVDLLSGPELLLTVTPLSVLRSPTSLNLGGFEDAVAPTFGQSMDWSPTLEGFLVWSPTGNGSSYAQTLIHRAGYVEARSSQGSPHKPDSRWVWASEIERTIRLTVTRSITKLGAHGLEGPWVVMASLHAVEGYDLFTDDRYSQPDPSNRPQFRYTELIFETVSEEVFAPLFNQVWWGFRKERPAGWQPPK